MLDKIDKERRLYVIKSKGGYSCLGFDVMDKRAIALAKELGAEWDERKGTKKAYRAYEDLVRKASLKNSLTGWRGQSQLHPQLIGLEQKLVEVVDQDGEIYRFTVGKSTGFTPCHLQLSYRSSSGGQCVDQRPFNSVRVIY